MNIRPLRKLSSFHGIDPSETSRAESPSCSRLTGLGGFDSEDAAKAGAGGATAGSAYGPWGAAGGAAGGVALYSVTEGQASGASDPASGKSGAYLVDHPEARGGLSKAEAYRMAFRQAGDRMWVNDSLQSVAGGYVPVNENGAKYDDAHYVVPPVGWGLGPHELWLLSEWASVGRPTLTSYRAHLYALGKAPSWYLPAGSDEAEQAMREANQAAYDQGQSGYWGDVLEGGDGSVSKAGPPVGRPRFEKVGPARNIKPMSEGSSVAAWVLGGCLVAGAAWLVLRKGK